MRSDEEQLLAAPVRVAAGLREALARVVVERKIRDENAGRGIRVDEAARVGVPFADIGLETKARLAAHLETSASSRSIRSTRGERERASPRSIASARAQKTLPGFKIPAGSSAALRARMSAISSAPRESGR